MRKASFGEKPSISNCHAFMRYPRGPASRHRGIVKGDLLAPENIVDVHIRRPDEREPGGLSAARCSGRACDASNIGSVWLSCIPQQKRDEPSAFPPLKAIRRKMGRFWLSQDTILLGKPRPSRQPFPIERQVDQGLLSASLAKGTLKDPVTIRVACLAVLDIIGRRRLGSAGYQPTRDAFSLCCGGAPSS